MIKVADVLERINLSGKLKCCLSLSLSSLYLWQCWKKNRKWK